ncbi:MAG: hypothetical protein L6Q72_16385 [Burkholderiaceae bacterium]|nr:hypothetical protein [Burkholderiaceae bacterium]
MPHQILGDDARHVRQQSRQQSAGYPARQHAGQHRGRHVRIDPTAGTAPEPARGILDAAVVGEADQAQTRHALRMSNRVAQRQRGAHRVADDHAVVEVAQAFVQCVQMPIDRVREPRFRRSAESQQIDQSRAMAEAGQRHGCRRPVTARAAQSVQEDDRGQRAVDVDRVKRAGRARSRTGAVRIDPDRPARAVSAVRGRPRRIAVERRMPGPRHFNPAIGARFSSSALAATSSELPDIAIDAISGLIVSG